MTLGIDAMPEDVAEALGLSVSDIGIDRVTLIATIDGMFWWDWAHEMLEMPYPPAIEKERAMIRGRNKVAEAQEFARRHGFNSFRFKGDPQRKSELGHVCVNVEVWTVAGAAVTFDEDAGRINVSPSDGRPPFYYEGRKGV